MKEKKIMIKFELVHISNKENNEKNKSKKHNAVIHKIFEGRLRVSYPGIVAFYDTCRKMVWVFLYLPKWEGFCK